MAKQGRKTLLNDEMIQKIVDATLWGNYATTICDYVGISTMSLHNWLKKGEALSEVDDRELTSEEQLFVKLFYEVKKARGLSEMKAVEKIRKAGEQDWKAAAWFLERTATQRWGRVDRHEITGAEGGAVEISAESVTRKLEALLANREAITAEVVDAEVVDTAEQPDPQTLMSQVEQAMETMGTDTDADE
jgi:hypothetical protein